MKNLSAEMKRFGVAVSDIQVLLGCTEKTVRNKINGATTFSIDEATKIRDAFFPGMRIEYDGSEAWYIYKGRIPPKWIMGYELMKEADHA